MSALTLRNPSGETVEMTSYAATDAKNNFGKLMQVASRRGAVAITRHNAPEAVLLSIEQYQALVEAGSHKLDDLSQEFDALLTRMQSPKATRGARAAFNAAPTALGKTAVAQARKRH